jgi:hypothetical protein
MLVAHVAGGLQPGEHFLALGEVGEGPDLPQLPAQQLRMGVAQHLDQVGVDVLDLRGRAVEEQNAILGGFKQATIAGFRHAQSASAGRIGWGILRA